MTRGRFLSAIIGAITGARFALRRDVFSVVTHIDAIDNQGEFKARMHWLLSHDGVEFKTMQLTGWISNMGPWRREDAEIGKYIDNARHFAENAEPRYLLTKTYPTQAYQPPA